MLAVINRSWPHIGSSWSATGVPEPPPRAHHHQSSGHNQSKWHHTQLQSSRHKTACRSPCWNPHLEQREWTGDEGGRRIKGQQEGGRGERDKGKGRKGEKESQTAESDILKSELVSSYQWRGRHCTLSSGNAPYANAVPQRWYMATEGEREREREEIRYSVTRWRLYPHKISFSYHASRCQMISLETNKDDAIVQRTNMINDNWHGGRCQDKQSCDPS